MENYDERAQKNIKEKSIYLLHLDTPRIIIIASVLIGLLAITFLIGMNINVRNEQSTDPFTERDPLFDLQMNDSNNENKIFENTTSDISVDNNAVNSDTDNNSIAKPNNEVNQNVDKSTKFNTANNENNTDVLSNDTIKEIIPPSKVIVRTPQKDRAADNKIKTKKPEQRKKSTKKRKTVEVSSSKKKNSFKSKHYFAIQVASYDSNSRASSEIRKLKRLRYDAFIDRATVSGRKYYRVRIGPIFSKRRAIDMLNEVQDITKYEESYLIRE